MEDDERKTPPPHKKTPHEIIQMPKNQEVSDENT
jgi:hypothetical protein